jgi:hypothetical protein
MVTCPTCGAVNADESTTCSTCGNSLTGSQPLGDGAVDDGLMTRAAYLARAMQTAALAIVVVSILGIIFGFARGWATPTPITLNRFERISVGIAEQAIPAFLVALLVAMALALLPWLLSEELPWKSLSKAPAVLIGSTVCAVIAAIVSTVNVRANLIVQKPATSAFKWKLAAYLVQALGFSVIIIVIAAVGLGMTRRRASDFPEPILPDDSHGHEGDHVHDHSDPGHTH